MSLSATQLRRAATLQERIENLQNELATLLGSTFSNISAVASGKPSKRKSGISPAGRKRIAAAQKARWAKAKAESEGAAVEQ